jgi:hypothetical protein
MLFASREIAEYQTQLIDLETRIGLLATVDPGLAGAYAEPFQIQRITLPRMPRGIKAAASAALLRSQRGHRIDQRGPPRWDEACSRSNRDQRQRYQAEDFRIKWACFVK